MLSFKTKGFVKMCKSMRTEISMFTLGSKLNSLGIGAWFNFAVVKFSQTMIVARTNIFNNIVKKSGN